MKKIIYISFLTIILISYTLPVYASTKIDNSINILANTKNTKTDTSTQNCESLFGEDTAVGKYIHDIYNIIKFAVPIILLAMSIKDFASGIVSQNDSNIKKATTTFSKRLIIAILILVVPTILNFILGLFDIPTCF